ncbi:MAG: hypothetical protein NUV85_02045 [Candidatus Berkelbacteria bacterium]|nr:hypothetical protein [Candidatus Berkelbacteria bacterium]
MIKSFFIFLLTGLLFLASFGYVVYRLQDPEFVGSQSRSVNLYGRLVSNVGGLLPADELKQMGFNNADIADVLKTGVEGEQFYEFEEAALKAYLPWLTGKTDSLSFSYSLVETKIKLTDATSAKILAKYNNLPICTSAELRDWSFESGLPSCQLASGTLKAKSITNLAMQAATKLTEGVPDSLSTAQPPSQLLAVRTNIALAFKIIYAIWGATLLLALIFLLLFRSSGFISLAVCFFLVGLLQIAFSMVGWDWITKTIGDFVGGSGEAKSIAPAIIDLVSVILGAMKTVMGNISIGFLISGGVLLVMGIVGKIHRSALIPKDAK